MASAVWAVQTALVDAIRASAPLAVLDASVYSDRAPDNARVPYIVIGDTSESDFHAFRQPGHVGAVTLHLWAGKDDRDVIAGIYNVLETLLNGTALALAGGEHVMYVGRLRFVTVGLDADGRTLHGVAEYTPTTREV